eukprot:357759-Chlamydomonas_euryale.AAC.7
MTVKVWTKSILAHLSALRDTGAPQHTRVAHAAGAAVRSILHPERAVLEPSLVHPERAVLEPCLCRSPLHSERAVLEPCLSSSLVHPERAVLELLPTPPQRCMPSNTFLYALTYPHVPSCPLKCPHTP